MSDADELVLMQVKGLMLDPTSNIPIVILREVDGALFLPIWIGAFEANAIAIRIEGLEPPRPLTHDLLRTVLQHLDTSVERIVISDLKENTFYASIRVRRDTEEAEIDARPSDAIALALRTDAPIFVHRLVLERARSLEISQSLEDDEEKIKTLLEELDPEDLGKYEM